MAWQDTEVALAGLHALDSGQLRHVEALCQLLATRAAEIREERR
jgi:hypothetical protein